MPNILVIAHVAKPGVMLLIASDEQKVDLLGLTITKNLKREPSPV